MLGVAYAEEPGAFRPHIWVEVFVDDRWVGVDAAQKGWHADRIAFAHDADHDADGKAYEWVWFIDDLRVVSIQPRR